MGARASRGVAEYDQRGTRCWRDEQPTCEHRDNDRQSHSTLPLQRTNHRSRVVHGMQHTRFSLIVTSCRLCASMMIAFSTLLPLSYVPKLRMKVSYCTCVITAINYFAVKAQPSDSNVRIVERKVVLISRDLLLQLKTLHHQDVIPVAELQPFMQWAQCTLKG